MLARDPRGRYQTASELIVDLERSRLAAPVPTFADPNQALQDPWVQQCLASSAEPTRLDPETPPVAPPIAPEPRTDGVWVLRYHNPAGKLCRTQATTEQIAVRLRRGRLSAKIEARRADGKDYHALSFYPEFKDIPPLPRPPRKRSRTNEEERLDPTPPQWALSRGIGASGCSGTALRLWCSCWCLWRCIFSCTARRTRRPLSPPPVLNRREG